MSFLNRLLRRNVTVRMNVPTVADIQGLTVPQLYATQPALRSVVSFLSDNTAQLPLHCYLRKSDTDRVRDTTSDIALLIKQPNLTTTLHELIRDSASDYHLYGWFLWVILPDERTLSGWSITHIPTAWFEQWPTMNGLEPVEYIFTNPETSKRLTIKAEDCIRFYGYGARGPMHPESPIKALKQILAEQVSAWSYRNNVWKNGGLVSSYLTRPKDAPDWVQSGARSRFVASWKAKFSGKDGTDTGGTPLLEDGMELKTTQFNAKEAQWMETTKLSREEVAGVYHVNPSLIWHTDGQTYASAKDNARALYSDTLAPFLEMLQERINAFLLPMIGADPNSYVEFYLDAKLQGSFEERAQILQSAVGGPWMLRDEARAMNNLPSVPGGDQLIVPLNVIEGGLASPNDTDPSSGWNAARPTFKSADGGAKELKSRGKPGIDESLELARCLRKFFERQSRSVLSAIDRAKDTCSFVKAEGDDFPAWWDAKRWDKELAADLAPLFQEQAAKQIEKTLAHIERDPEAFDPSSIENYIKTMALGKAHAINNVTYRQLQAAIDEEVSEDAEGSTPKGVFDKAADSRADRAGISFATAVAGWAVLEAVRQQASDAKAIKRWITTSGNPRAEHAAMDGEEVPVNDVFSNGAAWPGDGVLSPEESCNCQCQVEIVIS